MVMASLLSSRALHQPPVDNREDDQYDKQAPTDGGTVAELIVVECLLVQVEHDRLTGRVGPTRVADQHLWLGEYLHSTDRGGDDREQDDRAHHRDRDAEEGLNRRGPVDAGSLEEVTRDRLQ